jgi:hypothetical protein
MKTAFIICGALGREVLDIIGRQGWEVDVFGIPAIDHMYPERIAPDVEKRFREIRQEYDHVLVVFGDCGSRGALDEVLTRFGLERIDGPHCYEMYGGQTFHNLMEEEPGTFFLTDFLVRGFQGTIVRGLGLDRFPELKDDYFRHYKRLVYLVQNEDPALIEKARESAEWLGLPLEIRSTGYGLLEQRLINWMEERSSQSAVGSRRSHS